MKKIMVALFVAFMVIVGTIGMGSEKALAEPVLMMKHEAADEVNFDSSRIVREVRELEAQANRYLRAEGYVDSWIEFKDLTFDGETIEVIVVGYESGKRVDAEVWSFTLPELEDTLVEAEAYFADAAYDDIWG